MLLFLAAVVIAGCGFGIGLVVNLHYSPPRLLVESLMDQAYQRGMRDASRALLDFVEKNPQRSGAQLSVGVRDVVKRLEVECTTKT